MLVLDTVFKAQSSEFEGAGKAVSEDGRLCAAAFVQNRRSYTGCTDAPNPSGESGRPWCYVEAQVRERPTLELAFKYGRADKSYPPCFCNPWCVAALMCLVRFLLRLDTRTQMLVGHVLLCASFPCSALCQLLGTDAAEAAWNYCAAVVDYDALRKEVITVFADRAVEVHGLVAKLQKTQRAAEQALDRYFGGEDEGRVAF